MSIENSDDRTDDESSDGLEAAIRDHYGVHNLDDHVVSAFERAGHDIDDLDRDDIASFDEFHIRGRDATRELAELAAVEPGDRVLDVGCGVGGAARTLAVEHDADVTGVDVVEEYCVTARRFSERVGLGDRLQFERANALNLPYEDGAFDVAWFQHTLMNVPANGEAIAEAGRVLRDGGTLALYEICAGPGGEPHFPVPWAPDASLNYLETPEALRDDVAAAGFRGRAWRDVSATSLEWFRDVVATMASMPDDAQPLGLNLLMGSETPEKAENVVRNLEENRVTVVMAAFDREG